MGERLGVVVGVDGSSESCAALLFALEEAARRGTGLRVVSVLVPPQFWPNAYGLSAPPTIQQMKDDLRVVARHMANGAVAERPDLAAVPVELHEVEGRPAEVLVDQSRGADLLVVGHRGRGGFASALLGSVGLQCLMHAECPVTVVRPAPTPQTEREERPAVEHVVRPGFADTIVGPLY